MRKFFIYLKVILMCGPAIIFNFFRYLKYTRHPEKYPFEKRYGMVRKEILFVLRRFHIDYKEEGYDILKNAKKPALCISNHYSFMDPVMLIAASERPITFLSKKENLKMPFVGQILKMLQAFTIDRKNVLSQVRTLQQIAEHLKDETKPHVFIFIEGTRNKKPEGELLEFHPGTLKIAYKANCNIVPVTTYGTFRVLLLSSYLKKYPFLWKIHEPITPEQFSGKTTIDLAKEIRDEMNEQVNHFRVIDKEYIYNEKVSLKRKALETVVDLGVNS